MSTPDPVLYRAATREDLPFILSSWVRSYARGNRGVGITRGRYIEALRGTIADIFRRDSTRVLVACNRLDPRQIWGWCCFDTGQSFPVVHFTYVKELFRGVQIGSTLLAHARDGKPGVMRYTFPTKAARRFVPEAKLAPELVTRAKVREANG